MRVYVCGHTQRMTGYEILFSMVVCLLFAFGFASLRAVRALFVKDTFSACVRILMFLLLFFFVSYRFLYSFSITAIFFFSLVFFFWFSIPVLSFYVIIFFSSIACVCFVFVSVSFWCSNICINDTRAQQSNKSNLVWG